MSGGTLYTSAKRPGGQILGGTLYSTTPVIDKVERGKNHYSGQTYPMRDPSGIFTSICKFCHSACYYHCFLTIALRIRKCTAEHIVGVLTNESMSI